MWSLADEMERWLKVMLEEAEERFIEIRRSELANHFSCVPSQVTYVLSTRFVPERGYRVISRRGAGGFIRIERLSEADLLDRLAEQVTGIVSEAEAVEILNHLYQAELLSEDASRHLDLLVSDEVLSLPPAVADRVRARMVLALLANI
ncbi:MAG TPA: CtsR family transcriptional regulator [Firmicutes bacterium]|jgi:transcriptional regulator CtsR|nr:CtsR family transcriptional regulator [Bacillota bacterium]